MGTGHATDRSHSCLQASLLAPLLSRNLREEFSEFLIVRQQQTHLGDLEARPRLMLAAVGASLWLDLRGAPCAGDLEALLSLYGSVRKRFDLAGLPPPSGAAVAGVFHNADELDGEEEDGELSVLALMGDGALRLEDSRVGLSILASAEDVATQNAAALAAIRMPEAYLALLGADKDVLPLFDFSLSSAQHCRGISGSSTVIVTEVRSSAALAAVSEAQRQDETGVPIALVLQSDPRLWFDALSGQRHTASGTKSPPVVRGTSRGGGRGRRGTGRARGPRGRDTRQKL